MRDIGGDMISADSEHRCVPDIAIDIERHIGRATTDVANNDAHLAFGLRKNDLRGSERVEYKLHRRDPGIRHTLPQIFYRGRTGRDDVRLDLQAVTVHTDWHANSVLSIHSKVPLDYVDHFSIVRDRNRPSCVHGPGYILLIDGTPRNADNAATVYGGDMRAC